MTDRKDRPVGSGDDLQSLSRRGFDLVQADPEMAERLLWVVVRATDEGDVDPTTHVTALWGLGRLAHDRGAIDDALIVYRDAVTMALDTDCSELAAEVRVSWSVCLQASGETDHALEQLAIAEPFLSGASAGRLHMQRGFLMAILGERSAAIEQYNRALPLLVSAGDELAVTRLISNRGVLHLQLGDSARASTDFLESQKMAERLGQRVLAAGALHNLAYLDGRLGRFPAALRGFAAARRHYADVGSPGRYIGDLDIDECGVMIEAGLGAEAEQIARRVVEAARTSGNTVQLAEALVSLARSRLMVGDAAGAELVAEEASVLFGASGRSAWIAVARYLVIIARAADEGRRRTALRHFVRLRDVADRLERHGWLSEAAEVRVLTGRYALEAGRRDIAGDVLSTAAGARRHPLARVRAEAWYAAALLAEADGDQRATFRALDAGLRSVDTYRATLGAADLRSRAAQLGAPLADLGLRLAIEGGSPLTVLRWAERCRAAAIGAASGPFSAEMDVDAAAGLDQLRQARLALADARAGDDATTRVLVSRVADLESEVTGRTRHRDAVGATRRLVIDTARLRRELGDTTLIEFIETDGDMYAVVIGDGPSHLTRIGTTSTIVAANDHLTFALRRLAFVPPGLSAARFMAAFALAADELDSLLFGPLRKPSRKSSMRQARSGPLIIVPTGALHSVMWSALPTGQRAHGMTIAPSATWWLGAGDGRGDGASRQRSTTRRRSVLLVAGPDIRHADAEIAALRRLYPTARVLTGREATVGSVADAMSVATLVHIAAHGSFRSDNPLFSTIRLHDGPLSVHELEALSAVPETVVITACSVGRNGVLTGDELLGTSASLLALGVRALAAPLLPISDSAVVPVALALHRGLRSGHTLSAALAHCAVAAERTGHADVLAAASSFSCFGSRTSSFRVSARP